MTSSDWVVIGPGLLAGLLVMITHVPLGHEVLRRGVIFIDLAIAQFAAVGLLWGLSMDLAPHSWALQLTALSGALLGAALMAGIERLVIQQEAMIGIFFVLAATGAILLADLGPHSAQQLKDLLSGQILFIEYTDLLPAAFIAVAMLALMWWRPGLLATRWFYLLFALALTISVQHVGVYLVFASLIVPACATLRFKGRFALAVGIGCAGYWFGLWLSLLSDWLAGPLIVWLMGGFALIIHLILARFPAIWLADE